MMKDGQANNNSRCSESTWRTRVAVVSALIAFASGVIAYWSYESAKDALKCSERATSIIAYMSMRRDFRDIYNRIPKQYFDENHPPISPTDPGWNSACDYWYFAFDEWYVTTQFDASHLKQLWNDRFKHLIAPQMDRPAFRSCLCYLIKEKFSTNKVQKEFGAELARIYKSAHHKELCGSY